MPRSLKKGPYVDPKLAKKVAKAKMDNTSGPIKTWSRRSTITPDMVGLVMAIHNGKDHIPVNIIEDMVGHKLGELAPTRKFVRHGGKIQRELEASQKAAEVTKAKAEKEKTTK